MEQDKCELRDEILLLSRRSDESSLEEENVVESKGKEPYNKKHAEFSDSSLKAGTKAKKGVEFRTLISTSFDTLAVGEFLWLQELKQLGYSMHEIADLLVEQATNFPWPISVKEVLRPKSKDLGLYQVNCVHGVNAAEMENHQSRFLSEVDTPSRKSTIGFDADGRQVTLSAMETAEYLCGLAGCSPGNSADRNNVVFEDSNSRCFISIPHAKFNYESVRDLDLWQDMWAKLFSMMNCWSQHSIFYKRKGFAVTPLPF